MLRRLAFLFALAVGAAFPYAGPASAAIADGALAGRAAVTGGSAVESVAYVYGGRNYCFYNGGWRGPGWYWCGYAWNTGLGWGGAYGWRGWTYRGYRGGYYRGAHVAHHGYRGGYRGGAYVGHHGYRGGHYGGARVGHHGGYRGGHYGGARVGHHGGGMRMGGGGRGGGRRSDLRLKHDVVLLGRLQDGLGYYRFTYNGGHTPYVGVMAQEVQTVMPAAVTRGADGYLRVSYDRLGIPFETYAQWLATGGRLPTPR